MQQEAKASETIVASNFPRHLGAKSTSVRVTTSPRRSRVERNFILQLGFADPSPSVRSLQYSALVFQPRTVMLWIFTGILLQSSAVFAVLGAFLWWSAMLPKWNPFTALYNWTLGKRPGAFHLGPAPTPRRAAETEAGTTAITIALLLHTHLMPAACVVEAIFLAASLAVQFGGFCLGAFVFHIARGNGRFALQTLPWTEYQMPYEMSGGKTGTVRTAKGDPSHGAILN